ncbi:hypothetical protein COU54_01660 [Candidatus Pacearchaeota archaeon CG10_big_fil_rev_8_21_14_0_10_31_24]|nr:MAG: hypothetical protein COU54_01660 [Candidatus Pacearchaeota archaeon CG10_big_fil_rev_8_21_14_0_10_31_24]
MIKKLLDYICPKTEMIKICMDTYYKEKTLRRRPDWIHILTTIPPTIAISASIYCAGDLAYDKLTKKAPTEIHNFNTNEISKRFYPDKP